MNAGAVIAKIATGQIEDLRQERRRRGAGTHGRESARAGASELENPANGLPCYCSHRLCY